MTNTSASRLRRSRASKERGQSEASTDPGAVHSASEALVWLAWACARGSGGRDRAPCRAADSQGVPQLLVLG
jgi:hypothetical protein